jgi:hypothetical protein
MVEGQKSRLRSDEMKRKRRSNTNDGRYKILVRADSIRSIWGKVNQSKQEQNVPAGHTHCQSAEILIRQLHDARKGMNGF